MRHLRHEALHDRGAGYEDEKLTGINLTWAGSDTALEDILDEDRKKIRVPFPSGATLAAQACWKRSSATPTWLLTSKPSMKLTGLLNYPAPVFHALYLD
ncbi:MAG: hypothetical protein R3F37_17930 [Candidatus Competibacteraceae bacterium]